MMGNRKLILCCILGIVLGFLAPFTLNVTRGTALSIGMVAGLGIGYLLDILDEKKDKETNTSVLSEKAREANRLMSQARAELSGKGADPAEPDEPEAEDGTDDDLSELSGEEQSEKLNEAEEMLRKARERIRK